MDSLIDISKELIKNFTDKSWQEIENLKLQLNNLSKNTDVEKAVHNALNDLLTSYYIFIGRLESILDDDYNTVTVDEVPVTDDEAHADIPEIEVDNIKDAFIKDIPEEQISDNPNIEFEPFEYFVDFDEPVGNPISDKDLYGN